MSSSNQSGFSLLELTIVMSIAILLTSTITLRYRAGQENIARKNAVQQIAQAVRGAQHRALASICETPPCRLGVHFRAATSTFELFDDKDKDGAYTPGEGVKQYILEGKVAIANLLPAYACGGAVCLDILFDPPEPVTTFQPSGGDTVTIVVTGGRTVVVGRGGSVEVN